jgi:hypothetical protein
MAKIEVLINDNVVHSRIAVDQVCEFVGKNLFDDYQIEALRIQGLKAEVVISEIQSKMNSSSLATR